LIFVSQGIDTDSEQAEVLLATHGIVDSLYIKELSKKTHRGVEGRALQGFHTGGRCFGYRSVPIEDQTRTDTYGRPQIVGVKLEVHPEQAVIVRRIFADYAAGDSITTIAKRLNAEGVPSPAPYRGQRHPSWAPSAISVMLHNDRYSGTMVWNRTRKVRDPGTGRRLQRLRPRGDWTVVESPHLRIVPDEIWRAVVKRLASVNATFSSGPAVGLCSRSYTARYLSRPSYSAVSVARTSFSSRVVEASAGRSTAARSHQNRGICANTLVVRRGKLENFRSPTGSFSRRHRRVRPRGIQAPVACAPGRYQVTSSCHEKQAGETEDGNLQLGDCHRGRT
jgi:site-specific DNA recombinase